MAVSREGGVVAVAVGEAAMGREGRAGSGPSSSNSSNRNNRWVEISRVFVTD